VSDVKGLEPHTFQLNAAGRTELRCRYVLTKDNVVKFKIDNYSPDATVIIDPTLVFSTFTGSRADNWGYTATYDASGNFYSGSIVLDDLGSGNGFPVTAGAFQGTFQGGDGSEGGNLNYDVGIMKFNGNGTNRVYATYIGGGGDEQPHSLIVDPQGNLIIAGRTSSSNFPTMNNYPQGTYGPGGGFDIFLFKLNAAGTAMVGSLRIGGKGNDGVNIAPKYGGPPSYPSMGQHSLRLNYGDDGRSEVILDGAGNIFLASCTQSGTGDFPLSPNAFQRTFGGGLQDGVFIKTDPTCQNILACSYLGGNGDDAAFVLDVNPVTGNIYVGGGTASTNFPGVANAPPVLYGTYQGAIDGFVSIISPDGGTLIKSSYFGTSGTEVIYGIKFDAKGFPYIMGTTTGAWPVTPATVWSQPKGKQFIAKLMPDLSNWVYSTTFGKGANFPDISPTAFLVDRCENVYVAGWGGGLETEGSAVYNNSGTTGLSVTPDAIQKTTDGADFYFFILAKNAASQLYGSYFGQFGGLGDHVDGGTSRYDRQGIIYEAICANCYDQASFPTTRPSWSPTNGTGRNGCNLAAVKIAFNFAGVSLDVKPYINGIIDSAGCIPLNVTFKDTIRNAKSYIWHFADGTPDTTTVSYQVSHVFNAVGTYPVRIIAIDSSSCNISDTMFVTIRANNNPATLNFNIVKLAPCQSLSYKYFNTSTVSALGPPFGPASFIWDFGDGSPRIAAGLGGVPHSYLSPGTYTVKLILADTNYCNYPDSLSTTLRVAPLVKSLFMTPDTGCAPYTAYFNNVSTAGQQFIWNFGDGTIDSTDFSPTHLYPNVGTYTVTLIAIDSNTCNIADTSQKIIHVYPKPHAAFTFSPNPPLVANKPTIFTNNSTGATHYVWIFGDGDTTYSTNPDTVMHQYQRTATFQACLVAINQFGCTDTTCQPVQTLINPLLDVPNAFTPGRFGQNGIVKVQGFGIASMTFRIYNRWGQLMFESNDPNRGWDGTYRGNPQPMDVYAYTLEATFFDGTRTSRKGDITLIR
jgi:gliding motility-associated-like protein